MSVPQPNENTFDEAAQVFNQKKPIGTRIAGLAIVIGTQILWSVNYEVDDPTKFPVPKAENRDVARAKFQSSQPTNAAVVQCSVCQIKPGGLVLTKWQVTYAVKMQASASSKKSEKRREDKIKPPSKETKEDPTFRTVSQLFKTAIKTQQSVRQRMNAVFITKKNVDQYTSRDARTWFTKGKCNALHALKRIANKAKSKVVKEVQPVKFVKGETLYAKEGERKITFQNINPVDVYSGIRRKALIKRINEAKQDKLRLAAALYHITLCRKRSEGSEFSGHTARCEHAAYQLLKHDIGRTEIPTNIEMREILKEMSIKAIGLSQVELLTTSDLTAKSIGHIVQIAC